MEQPSRTDFVGTGRFLGKLRASGRPMGTERMIGPWLANDRACRKNPATGDRGSRPRCPPRAGEVVSHSVDFLEDMAPLSVDSEGIARFLTRADGRDPVSRLSISSVHEGGPSPPSGLAASG